MQFHKHSDSSGADSRQSEFSHLHANMTSTDFEYIMGLCYDLLPNVGEQPITLTVPLFPLTTHVQVPLPFTTLRSMNFFQQHVQK